MSGRRWVAGAILALWVGVMGWHLQREYFVPEPERLAEATRHLSPATHYYALLRDGDTVGTASSRLDTLPDGLVLEDRMEGDLPVPGMEGDFASRGRVELDRSLRLEAFSFELESGAGAFRSQGRLPSDSLLEVTVAGDAGGEDVREIPVEEPPVFQSALPIRLAMADRLVEGHRVELPVLDPTAGSTRRTEVEVAARRRMAVADSAVRDDATGRWRPAEPDTLDVWRVEERYGELTVETWVDAEGRVVRATTPFGVSMERIPFQLYQQADDDLREAREARGGGEDEGR